MFSPPKKPYFAVICRVMPLSKMYKVLLQCHVTLIFSTYLGISWQNKANRYTSFVVKIRCVTTPILVGAFETFES